MSKLVVRVRNQTRFDAKPIVRVLRACCKHHSIRSEVRLYLHWGANLGWIGGALPTYTIQIYLLRRDYSQRALIWCVERAGLMAKSITSKPLGVTHLLEKPKAAS